MSFLNKTPTKTKAPKSRGTSVFEDQDARAFLKEAINDLMVRKDRRTKLEYFRITSSPISASPSTSTLSSGMGSVKKQKVAPRRMSPEPPLLRTTTVRRTTVGGTEKRTSNKVDSALSSASSRPISVTRRLSIPVTSHKTPISSRPSAAATTTSSSGVKSSSTILLNTRKSVASSGPSKSRRSSVGSDSRSEKKKQNRSTSGAMRKSRRASKLVRKSHRSSVDSDAANSDASVKSASSGKGRSHSSARSAFSVKKKSRASTRSASTGKGKDRANAGSASADLRRSRRMSTGPAFSGARKSHALVLSASANIEQKRRDNSFFLDGPEYRRWLADSNAKNRVAVPTTMVPMRGRVEVSGVFKSQLAKYRPQESKDRENVDAHLQKRRELPGAENPPWTSQISVVTSRTPKPEPRVRNPLFGQSITPKQLKHAEKVLGKRFGLSTSLKNLSRSNSGKSKKFITSTVSHPSSSGVGTGANSTNGTNSSDVPLARNGSTAALFSAAPSSAPQQLRLLLDTPCSFPLPFSPMVFSTPVRRTMSEMALVSPPPLTRTTQSLHAVPTTSSSIYRTPVRKTPPTKSWLIDAAKQMERAHNEGRRVVLSNQTPLGTRAARRPRSLTPPPSVCSLSNGSGVGRVPVPIRSRSASASVSPSKKPVAPTPVPRTVSLAPAAQKSLTTSKPISNVGATPSGGSEQPKFTHYKKIKMRLLVDHNEHIDADCSLHFESSSRNPKIKVAELRVDDCLIWRKGGGGGGNASMNNNSSSGSNGGSAASFPTAVSATSSSTGLYYQTPPSTL